MSNSSTSQIGIKIPQYVLMFVVLALAIGALLLGSNGIDPKSGIRAAFTPTPSPTPVPVDPFASEELTTFSTPDKAIQLSYPKAWIPQANAQNGPYGYVFVPAGTPSTLGVSLFAVPVKSLNIPGATASSTPAELLKLALSSSGGTAPTIRDVQAGGLKGSAAHISGPQQDQNGATVNLDSDIWILTIDSQNILIITAQSDTARWPKMQTFFAHFTDTLKVDGKAVATTVTASLQPAATAAATTASTSAAVPAATAASTAASTAAPTLAATLAATSAK